MDVEQKARIIKESAEIVEKSKKLETRLSRSDVIVALARDLYKYERLGIPTLNPPPSALGKTFSDRRNQIIIESLAEEVKTARQKAALATGARSKVNHLMKSLLRVREYAEKLADRSPLTTLEAELKQEIHAIQLHEYLDAARKAEFKGNKKKALDQYYEALYFLRHDDIDDQLQEASIAEIEGKIKALGGNVDQ